MEPLSRLRSSTNTAQEGARDTPTPHEFAPQSPHWDGSHPIPTPAAGQGWAVGGHSLRSTTSAQERHPWVLPGGLQPWKEPSRLRDMEHAFNPTLALTQGGMVWRAHPALLQLCLPQDFRTPVLGRSTPASIQAEGNWFQFATHPRATDPCAGMLLAQQSWECGISHRTPQAQQSPTFSCSATARQRVWAPPNPRAP